MPECAAMSPEVRSGGAVSAAMSLDNLGLQWRTEGKGAFVSATPEIQLHEQFSSPDAAAMPWDEAATVLGEAEIYWVTTVRPDGRPHVTPLVAVWLDDALYFCTGDDERKARNLRENRSC